MILRIKIQELNIHIVKRVILISQNIDLDLKRIPLNRVEAMSVLN